MNSSVTQCAPPAAEVTEDERRAAIMKRLAEAKAARAAAAAAPTPELDAAKYGRHKGITCDGCNICPVIGYRWRCKNW